MSGIDRLRERLIKEYRKRTTKSRAAFERARRALAGGGSHTIRIWKPYPFFIAGAAGPMVEDIDGNVYIDYWQGHYANILGHNPAVVRRAVESSFGRGTLHTGFESEAQIELAEALVRQLEGEDLRVRFTTSGTLATMYAVMLAQGLTGRDLVLKVGGGWHGSSPYLLKGVRHRPGRGFQGCESAGVLDDIARRTLITRFNDGEDLEHVICRHGERIACFILEPFLGVGGFLPAEPEYLRLARDLTARHGILLVFDEIISGFRFCSSGVQTLYGLRPDLTTFGKIIGGGHAVAAVVGPRRIMEGCERDVSGRGRVLFEGGTFSSHAEYTLAGLAMLRHLVGRSRSIYPQLARLGTRLRLGIEKAFSSAGVPVRVTGSGNSIVPPGSLFMVHFPREAKVACDHPDDIHDESRCDIGLREDVLKLALLANGVHIVHGGGAVSTAHRVSDIDRTVEAYGEAARLIKRYAL